MIERLVIAALLILMGIGAWWVFTIWHRRLAGRAAGGDRPVLLYFRSAACAPCLAQGHYVQEVEERFDGRLVVRKIDADQEVEQATRYGVFTLPTTLVVSPAGTVKYINYGLTDVARLVRQVEKVL
ncbi:MAG: thioredoxin family protein [Chloroflexi bacterium]|nr:thioredoxin family protein [Chloroflexota bacterium]MCI0574605.1 thioredoxin family protein [Chloroflexota bacterium]MCI0644043.1 thioredoxin family protein [Chloroflexota bacterium]MCI0731717.1 thioredoxin family protein [Chloroflexota bacterium]